MACQELFPLPGIGGVDVRLCCFSVAGTFAGACVRVDPSAATITTKRDILPLRVVPDAAQ
jgi:glutathionylspermidine amidase/synthetase